MNDDDAWLIANEIPRLRRYARTLTQDAAAADDLVQDALERAMRKWRLWGRRGSLRAWLYRLLYNVFLNQVARARHRGVEVAVEEGPALATAPRQEDAALCREIGAAMAALPPEQRAAIALTAVEGLSYDEAAKALDIPIGTLRSRLFRGRETLRALLDLAPEAEAAERPRLRRVK
jgi:RNA polymerase sigma-70 factor (ECF subfamily)